MFSPLRRACVPYQMHNNVDLKIPQPSPTGFHTPLFFFFFKDETSTARAKSGLPMKTVHPTEDPAYHCTYYTIQQRPCLPLHVLHHSADPAYWDCICLSILITVLFAIALHWRGGGGGGGGEGGHSEIQPSPLSDIRSIGDA